jgi:hypothetical protein
MEIVMNLRVAMYFLRVLHLSPFFKNIFFNIISNLISSCYKRTESRKIKKHWRIKIKQNKFSLFKYFFSNTISNSISSN